MNKHNLQNAYIALKEKLYIKDFYLEKAFTEMADEFLNKNFNAFPERKVYIYKIKDQVVGVLFFDNAPEDEFDPTLQFFVKEEYRRKGIGKNLLEKFKSENPDAFISVSVNNEASIAFYDNVGLRSSVFAVREKSKLKKERGLK